MLMLLDRYEQILAAISLMKDYVLSGGKSGDLEALKVLIPVSIGAIISLIGVTNLLKWLLRRHEKPTVGFLLGIVLGSAWALRVRLGVEGGGDVALACLMVAVGFAVTVAISRIGAKT